MTMQNVCNFFLIHSEPALAAAPHTMAIGTYFKSRRLHGACDLCRTKHSRSEQIQFSATEHLAFHHF
jgi:hypothetical protein